VAAFFVAVFSLAETVRHCRFSEAENASSEVQ
jgi:hypothetical protein